MQIIPFVQEDFFSRIDYILCPSNWMNDVKSVEIGLRVYSDHAPVFMLWQKKEMCVNSKLRRLNNYVLEDKVMVHKFQKEMRVSFP